MADIVIHALTAASLDGKARRGGTFWTSTLVGYAIYVNTSDDLVYRKTGDGGATWGGEVDLVVGTIKVFDAWADWQTAGDAGTTIHIACLDATANNVLYVSLDTSTDTIDTDEIEAVQGTGLLNGGAGLYGQDISITKTRGGNLAVVGRYWDSTPTAYYYFYTSPDADNWTPKVSPWEAPARDPIQLFPGNEADNQDIWAVFWDASANEISLKTYDDSGDSWSEQSISGSMEDSTTYFQMGGAIRLSDGHLILAAWSEYATLTADLKVWDINGAGSITAKANILTDTIEYFQASVFINQANDDIYVAYFGGTAAGSEVKARYQKSTDGATSWGGDTVYQADVEDDMRWISCGAIKAAWGGRFEPIWSNNDWSDLFTNFDNSISIAVPSPPTGLEDKSANMGAKMIAGKLI